MTMPSWCGKILVGWLSGLRCCLGKAVWGLVASTKGSNPFPTAKVLIDGWCSGNTVVSKTTTEGSIPSLSAKFVIGLEFL